MTTTDPAAATAAAMATRRLQRAGRGIQQQVDRRIRRVETSTSGLRRVTVATRDPATRSCTVRLDGDTSSDPVPCGILSSAVVPVVGQEGWAHQNGTDLLLAGLLTGELPKAMIRTTRDDQPVGSGLTVAQFDAATGGFVVYDTDNDGVSTMADLTGDRLTCRWPGKYAVSGVARINNKSTAGADVVELLFTDVSTGGQVAIARVEVNTNQVAHLNPKMDWQMDVGDYVQLWCQSTGSATTFGYSPSDDDGSRTTLAMAYLP